MDKKRKLIIITAAVAAAVIALAAGVLVYLFDYYPADAEEMAIYNTARNEIAFGDDIRAYEPRGEKKYGLIFYPGAKIEYTAYAPLLNMLADNGVVCITVKMPFNLAVFGKDSAIGLNKIYPEVEHWYIGGHSLGGAMAADFASEVNGIEGVVLLAAYPSKDISGTDLRVLSIYGSEDGILDLKKYEKARSKMPEDLTEHIIEGGTHSGFACYGEQRGDGVRGISPYGQMTEAAEKITDFIYQRNDSDEDTKKAAG